MIMTIEIEKNELEHIIMEAVQKALQATHHEFFDSGWLSLKDGAKYAGVSYNTLMKYRTLGLQVCEIDGVKRISRKEIDRFFYEHSF